MSLKQKLELAAAELLKAKQAVALAQEKWDRLLDFLPIEDESPELSEPWKHPDFGKGATEPDHSP